MAVSGDLFRTTFLVEVAGIQTQQKMDWRLDSILGADTLDVVLGDLAQAWWDTVKNVLVNQCMFSCMFYQNWSRVEQYVIYPGLAGLAGTAGHPQFQVVRLNIYGRDPGALDPGMKRGASNLSGVTESLSTRGRINDLAEFSPWQLFNIASMQTSATGWEISPRQRWLDTGPVPAVYSFVPVVGTQVNPTFKTLRRRKTTICTAM